ncbi:MAG: MFS transporter [Chloroflexi bacterium]|nr:MFS transporter [Chloroflexota bacterium]
MTAPSILQSAIARMRPSEPHTMAAARITQLTYRYDKLRAIPTGMLESAGSTFLLLIAVQAYQAGATEKALIAAGGNVGMLLTPLVVQWVERYRWTTSRAAAVIAMFGALCFLLAGLIPTLPAFVAFSVAAVSCTQALVPLMTQVYQDNYAPRERGRYYSRALVIRVGVSAVFAELAGRFLTENMDWFRWLLIVFAAAFALSSVFILRIPSRPLTPSGSSDPFRAVRYVLSDRVFSFTLIIWMLMGFANLMMMPMRVDYLANPRYGLMLNAQQVALLTSVIPSIARLVMGPVWGWLFDRANFFILRMVLNLGFALGIATFFTGGSMLGLIAGAVIFGISASGGDLAWSLWVTKFAPAERVADYMSVHTFLTGVRGVVAPIVAFQLVTSLSLDTLGWVSAGLIFIATLMLIPEIRFGHVADA